MTIIFSQHTLTSDRHYFDDLNGMSFSETPRGPRYQDISYYSNNNIIILIIINVFLRINTGLKRMILGESWEFWAFMSSKTVNENQLKEVLILFCNVLQFID